MDMNVSDKSATASGDVAVDASGIIDRLEDVTAAWLTATLRRSGSVDLGATVASVAAKVIGTGQLGSLARAEIAYEPAGAGPATLIVKLPSSDVGSRSLGVAMGIYDAEVRFYREVAPHVPDAVPALHHAAIDAASGRFTLLLEDVGATSQVGDMVAGCDVEHARTALVALAAVQAALWDHDELTSRPWLADTTRTSTLFAGIPMTLGPFLDRFRDRLRSDDVELVRRLIPNADRFVARFWRAPLVVAHGDYRLDNLMFGITAGARPVTIIDWQVARLGPALLDVAIFLGACLSTDVRREHQDELIECYRSALNAEGEVRLSVDDCRLGLREAALYPLLLTVGMSVTIEQTERGDDMWVRLLERSADLVRDLDASGLLD